MKKILSRLAAAMLAVLMVVGMMGVGASAEHGERRAECVECKKAGMTCKSVYATTSFKKISETQCARLYECNNGHRVFQYDHKGRIMDVSVHVPMANANCIQPAVCGNCHDTYGAPSGHNYAKVEVRQPTCAVEGATIHTCIVCGVKVESDKVKPLSHWYDEWVPAGAGLNSAPCKRPGCTHTKTTTCVDWDFKLAVGENEAEDYKVCPVCGAVSDGSRLELVQSAKPTPVTGWTPEGDLLFRQGTMANGEKIVCVGFEFDARLTQCTGLCKFTVPAELMEGCQVMLLNADGTETELEVETDATTATVALNFDNGTTTNRWTPVRMMHLIPLNAEETPAAAG